MQGHVTEFFVWHQFISTADIRDNFHFATSPVILIQDGVFDNTRGLLPVQGRGSTQNTILQSIDSNYWWQPKDQGCLVVFSLISLSVCR